MESNSKDQKTSLLSSNVSSKSIEFAGSNMVKEEIEPESGLGAQVVVSDDEED
jgi:hypothetical protein